MAGILKNGNTEHRLSVSYMPSETKLLYWAILRLRISEHGPSTRSKRCLSSLTHFKGPFATTVAARGLSKSRAISPAHSKQIIKFFLVTTDNRTHHNISFTNSTNNIMNLNTSFNNNTKSIMNHNTSLITVQIK